METKIKYSIYLSILEINNKMAEPSSDPALISSIVTLMTCLCQLEYTIERIMEVCNDPLPCCSPEGSPQQRAAH